MRSNVALYAVSMTVTVVVVWGVLLIAESCR